LDFCPKGNVLVRTELLLKTAVILLNLEPPKILGPFPEGDMARAECIIGNLEQIPRGRSPGGESAGKAFMVVC